MSVALVEPKVIGGGATAAGMGHLAVMDDSEAQSPHTLFAVTLEIARRTPSRQRGISSLRRDLGSGRR